MAIYNFWEQSCSTPELNLHFILRSCVKISLQYFFKLLKKILGFIMSSCLQFSISNFVKMLLKSPVNLLVPSEICQKCGNQMNVKNLQKSSKENSKDFLKKILLFLNLMNAMFTNVLKILWLLIGTIEMMYGQS